MGKYLDLEDFISLSQEVAKELAELRAELAAERNRSESIRADIRLEESVRRIQAEIQSAVLKEAVVKISKLKIDPTSPEIYYHHITDITQLVLDDLPGRCSHVSRVLEAADKWYDEWKDYGAMSLSYIELRDAIRERREK